MTRSCHRERTRNAGARGAKHVGEFWRAGVVHNIERDAALDIVTKHIALPTATGAGELSKGCCPNRETLAAVIGANAHRHGAGDVAERNFVDASSGCDEDGWINVDVGEAAVDTCSDANGDGCAKQVESEA